MFVNHDQPFLNQVTDANATPQDWLSIISSERKLKLCSPLHALAQSRQLQRQKLSPRYRSQCIQCPVTCQSWNRRRPEQEHKVWIYHFSHTHTWSRQPDDLAVISFPSAWTGGSFFTPAVPPYSTSCNVSLSHTGQNTCRSNRRRKTALLKSPWTVTAYVCMYVQQDIDSDPKSLGTHRFVTAFLSSWTNSL